jgi:hypothetical protein
VLLRTQLGAYWDSPAGVAEFNGVMAAAVQATGRYMNLTLPWAQWATYYQQVTGHAPPFSFSQGCAPSWCSDPSIQMELGNWWAYAVEGMVAKTSAAETARREAFEAGALAPTPQATAQQVAAIPGVTAAETAAEAAVAAATTATSVPSAPIPVAQSIFSQIPWWGWALALAAGGYMLLAKGGAR